MERSISPNQIIEEMRDKRERTDGQEIERGTDLSKIKVRGTRRMREQNG